jgi:hypothetical protein
MARTVRAVASAGVALSLLAVTGLALWADATASSIPAGVFEAPRITVEAGTSRVVCPAGLRLPSDDAGDQIAYDPRYDPAPASVNSVMNIVVEGAYGGQVVEVGQDDAVDLPGPVGAWTGEVASSPVSATVRTVTGFSPLAGGGILIESVGGDLGGLAGASCLAPRSESYIVGGGTDVGSSTRLILVNPGSTPATVDLTIWGPSGRVDAVGATGLILPPGSERVALLEGMVGGASRLVLKVSARGGEVAAYLQHSRLDGLIPAGVDFAVPGAGPAATVIVPGIASLATTLESPDPSALRLLITGREDGVATITVYGPDGPIQLPGTESVFLRAGEVTDLPLFGLPEGVYTATVESSRPIVAAALSTRFGDGPTDPRENAWASSGPIPTEGFLAVFPLTSAIAIGGPAGGDVLMEVVDPAGTITAEHTITVPPGTTRVLTPSDLGAEGSLGVLFTVEADSPGVAEAGLALAAVDVSADGAAIAVRTPTDASALARALSVEPLTP